MSQVFTQSAVQNDDEERLFDQMTHSFVLRLRIPDHPRSQCLFQTSVPFSRAIRSPCRWSQIEESVKGSFLNLWFREKVVVRNGIYQAFVITADGSAAITSFFIHIKYFFHHLEIWIVHKRFRKGHDRKPVSHQNVFAFRLVIQAKVVNDKEIVDLLRRMGKEKIVQSWQLGRDRLKED